MADKTPILYVLARNDLDSLNPGKLAAQVNHAGTKFVYDAFKNDIDDSKTELDIMFKSWIESANGFGTCIVLEAPIDKIEGLDKNPLFPPSTTMIGVVKDPSYPVRDGAITHLIPLTTCAYVFGYKEDLSLIFSNFGLHP